MCSFSRLNYIFITILSCMSPQFSSIRTFTEDDVKMYRGKVKQMFTHAYDNYLKNAFPYDELQPISCKGMDTWGSFSLTLIDALDTLAVMRNYTEFKRVVDTLLATANFNVNINVSVFETNIRVVGGLLSAHLLYKKVGLNVDPGWPCSGPLLSLAETVARKLLPAFNTTTGMPYGTVNLKYGVPDGETPITCTAGVSTFIVEFGTLSHLTGDPVFQNVADTALDALWRQRSSLGLVGNHINVQDGKWTALDGGIGGGVDSYFEYLVKGSILFQEPKYFKMFKEYDKVISKYMKKDDWYFWVSMSSGQVTMPTFQSLEAFWPGLLTLVGDIEQAIKTLYNYHTIWKQYGFTPEIYDVAHNHAKRDNYPLRPELIESVMYLYYATKDPHLLEIGVDILESIEHSAKTNCGYATIKNVVDHKIEDRMESFFLAETTKYLYLLFDPDNFIHQNGSCGDIVEMSGGSCVIGTGGYIFNTEAHPIDVGALYCCSTKHFEHQVLLDNFKKTMDLHSLLEIRDSRDFFQVFKNAKKSSTHRKKQKKLNPDIEILDQQNITELNSTVKESEFSNNTLQEESDTANLSLDIDNSKATTGDWEEHSNKIGTVYAVLKDKNTDGSASADDDENAPVFADTIKENTSNITLENNSTITYAKDSLIINNSSYFYNDEFFSYELLVCPAQPFTLRLNLMGEMFNT